MGVGIGSDLTDSPNAQWLNALVEQYENEVSAAEIETQLRILLGLPG